MTVVTGRDLVKRYGHTCALDGVTVEVPAAVLAAVTGPSGSGKTTLLHVLAGLSAPDAGTVEVAGRTLTGTTERERAGVRRELMGLVFQRANLLPALTVGENVALPLLLAGARRDDVRARTLEVLAQVGLADRGRSFPAELSGGEAQRVAVARAVAARPQVVWADEPTGALDSAAAADVLALLRELVQEGSTVVVVTHDRDVASRAELELRLRDGRRAS
jgi:putative ABC transport system ATP-binding protein